MTEENTARAEAVELKISPIGDFKKRMGGIFELPSGAVVRLKNPGGLEGFLGSGTIPNMLMPVVNKVMDKNQGKSVDLDDEELENMLKDTVKKDPKALEGMTELLNQVAVKTIVEPQCYPVPNTEKARRDDRLYADEVSLVDKQFIFQWITSGVKELEPFRK